MPLERSTRHSSGWRLNLAATSLAFVTYFCMYAFRKPFTAGTYAAEPWLGLDLKTTFIISQVLGYACSKYLGIKWVSEVTRRNRRTMILSLIGVAELALLGFAMLPSGGKLIAIFCNGLPLGMIWGLVVRYLEGRRASEILLSGLSCSFILASGVVKDVGRWLMRLGLDEYWMPFVAGALFFAPLVVAASWLDQIPDPDQADVAEREARLPMLGADRRAFVQRFLPGMVLLLGTYLALTAFRDFRDNYGVELFEELGYGRQPALFSATELPVAIVVLATMCSLSAFRGRVRGLMAVFVVILLGLGLVGGATFALDHAWLDGQGWMICIGLGAYLAYVPFSSFLFDRLMAATRVAGTAVFAVNLADAVGYSGSVGMQLYKDLIATESTHLGFFRAFSYGLSLGGCGLLLLAALYFWKLSRPDENVSAA